MRFVEMQLLPNPPCAMAFLGNAASCWLDRLETARLTPSKRFAMRWAFLPCMCGAWNRKGCSTAASTPGGIETVAQLTEGFSFAYLKELCLAAAMAWMNAGPQSSMDAIARIQAECLTAQMSSQPTEAEQPDGHLTPRQRFHKLMKGESPQ